MRTDSIHRRGHATLRRAHCIAMGLLFLSIAAGCGQREAPEGTTQAVAVDRPGTGATVAAGARLDDPAIDVPGWLAALQLMDADGDGRVSEAEHALAAKRMFRAMDRDGDRRVSVAEMAATRGVPPDELAKTERALGDADGNGDGVLDRREHDISTRGEFELVDTDHDGYVGAGELQAADTPTR